MQKESKKIGKKELEKIQNDKEKISDEQNNQNREKKNIMNSVMIMICNVHITYYTYVMFIFELSYQKWRGQNLNVYVAV